MIDKEKILKQMKKNTQHMSSKYSFDRRVSLSSILGVFPSRIFHMDEVVALKPQEVFCIMFEEKVRYRGDFEPIGAGWYDQNYCVGFIAECTMDELEFVTEHHDVITLNLKIE